ncbi:hypothetical protein AB1Y20_000783 [Prymnesium parvum]|uniref:Uncharacterized protein n=1 Tax=Prymnesium parvum TaxID=97485 RepID=A0AB34K900_PRYPA
MSTTQPSPALPKWTHVGIPLHHSHAPSPSTEVYRPPPRHRRPPSQSHPRSSHAAIALPRGEVLSRPSRFVAIPSSASAPRGAQHRAPPERPAAHPPRAAAPVLLSPAAALRPVRWSELRADVRAPCSRPSSADSRLHASNVWVGDYCSRPASAAGVELADGAALGPADTRPTKSWLMQLDASTHGGAPFLPTAGGVPAEHQISRGGGVPIVRLRPSSAASAAGAAEARTRRAWEQDSPPAAEGAAPAAKRVVSTVKLTRQGTQRSLARQGTQRLARHAAPPAQLAPPNAMEKVRKLGWKKLRDSLRTLASARKDAVEGRLREEQERAALEQAIAAEATVECTLAETVLRALRKANMGIAKVEHKNFGEKISMELSAFDRGVLRFSTSATFCVACAFITVSS